ncbi:MAG: helix-turn-helix transcriptional regulator [Kiritimatiellales bacterium]
MPTHLPKKLIRIFYYKAPRTVKVNPLPIEKGIEKVELVANGTVYFQCGTRDLKLGCGAMFWHVAGEKTIHRTEPSSPYECLAIHFSVNPHNHRPAPRLTIIADHQRTLELSQELLSAYHDTSVDRTALAHYAYSRFLWEAHRGTIQRTIHIHPKSLAMALAFLEASFNRKEVGVHELARAGGISESHLHVLFRRNLDQTPNQALLSRRLHEAKLILSSTDIPIKLIPSQCGFASIETFYRAFGRHIGMTPLAYRSRHLPSPRSTLL